MAKLSEKIATNITSQPITGFTSGAGTVAATDTLLQAISKLNGNDGTKMDKSFIQSIGTQNGNYTCNFNSGTFATVTTGTGVATVTIPDWASTSVSVDAWLYITQGATARIQTLGTASGTNNNIISSGGLMSAGDALPNSGASTTDAFQFTWIGTKWMVTNALYDVKV